MTVVIRRAAAHDAPALMDVKCAVWPDEGADTAAAARILCSSVHQVHVAELEGKIAGFVDGFVTIGPDGLRRWEVDLLAVHPDSQGRGLAGALVDASTHSGLAAGAHMARALVKMDNAASQRVFARCGYHCVETVCALYILPFDDSPRPESPPAGIPAQFVPVNTLSYWGVWLEGALVPEIFHSARAFVAQNAGSLAGAVIPGEAQAAITAAQAAGFSLAGYYHWWTCSDPG